jgi:hypothetical protein
MKNWIRNSTVIEFSSETLRLINLPILFISFQVKFIKENKISTLTELAAYERKKKIKEKLIEIEKIQETA